MRGLDLMDRRERPANEHVACETLRDVLEHHTYVAGVPRKVGHVLCDLCDAPGGRRDRQLVLGDLVTEYDARGGWSFVRSVHDGYVGYVKSDGLDGVKSHTHWVTSRFATLYTDPDFKSPDCGLLPLGAQVTVSSEAKGYMRCDLGWIADQHVRPISECADDPVGVAEKLLGTPYLWGGNSSFGIDCSGLVNIALKLCGYAAPADSDQQMRNLGDPVQTGNYVRNDLLFWRGHVAWVYDERHILHANAHHMAVTLERIDEAIPRIRSKGDGEIIAHKRIWPPR